MKDEEKKAILEAVRHLPLPEYAFLFYSATLNIGMILMLAIKMREDEDNG